MPTRGLNSWQLIRVQWQSVRQSRSRLQAWLYLLRLYVGLLFINSESPHAREQGFSYWFPQVTRYRMSFGNVLRLLIQSLYLLLLYRPAAESPVIKTSDNKLTGRRQRLSDWLFRPNAASNPDDSRSDSHSHGFGIIINRLFAVLASAAFIFALTLPMTAPQQGLLLLIFWALALWLRKRPGNFATLVLIFLSLFTSTRYIYWRVTETIRWDVPLDAAFGVLLLTAELYAWIILVLGYIQTAWPLQRKIATLPDNTEQWPSVDIYIPTYNEPLRVVKATLLAALDIEWPRDKLNVYLLDDGKRAEFKSYCEAIGAHYIARDGNAHAKAGNLNNALKHTQGDYIAIFDCDHIPTRGFLQMTMGWFLKNSRLAMLQTPHHFFSPDPFERNLSIFRSRPNEGELFYGLIQDGNDMWNASFFCGSCAVLRREPLEEVGGIAVETVTEDAHTALKMHRLGYETAYLNIPLAAGLATESLADHIGQRMRWARGMAQIFRIDNPLLGKGLNWAQRLCYSNAMLYFLNGAPRLIFLLAPLAFLLLDSYIVFAPAVMIAAYALPHIIHANLTNSRKQGQFRHSFWAEMYETVLAWYIFKPTTVALFNPGKGKFNVTAKGQKVGKQFFDWNISTPYLLLIAVSLLGLVFGVYRLFAEPAEDRMTVILNLAWLCYNLIIIGGAVAVAEEAKQQRNAHRITVNHSVTVYSADERAHAARLIDFSSDGIGLKFAHTPPVAVGELITVILPRANGHIALSAKVLSQRNEIVGTQLKFDDWQQEQDFIAATFGRTDAWLGWRVMSEERPLRSLHEVVHYGLSGYQRVAAQVAPYLVPFFSVFRVIFEWLSTFLPLRPGTR